MHWVLKNNNSSYWLGSPREPGTWENISSPVTSSQKICDNDYQKQFKDKGAKSLEVEWHLQDPRSWGRAGINYGSRWPLITFLNILPVCLLNELQDHAHCTFSLDSLSLINQHCNLGDKDLQSGTYMGTSLSTILWHVSRSVHIEHTQRKGETNRTEPKRWCKGLFSLWSDVLPNILGKAKNNLMLLFINYFMYTNIQHFPIQFS